MANRNRDTEDMNPDSFWMEKTAGINLMYSCRANIDTASLLQKVQKSNTNYFFLTWKIYQLCF